MSRRNRPLLAEAVIGALSMVLLSATAAVAMSGYDREGTWRIAVDADLPDASTIIVEFNDINAKRVDTFKRATVFGGGTYDVSHGVRFSTPGGKVMYIAPAGLRDDEGQVWNSSNSLSVGRFPFDKAPGDDNDSITITLRWPAAAVGFRIRDNGGGDPDEARFICEGLDEVVVPLANADFVGAVATDCPVTRIVVTEGANDGDDITYDDLEIIPACDNAYTNGRDVVVGDATDETLCGGKGSDSIDGGGGNDLILGGDNGDRDLVGGTGNDSIFGEGGSDVLRGGAGDDYLFGEDDPDQLVGGRGRDKLLGGKGPDQMLGGDGRDLFSAGPGDDQPIFTKDGIAETVRGGSGRDQATVDRIDKVAQVEVVKR